MLAEGGATLDAVGPGSVLGGRYTLGSRLEDAPHRSTWQAQDTTLDRRVQLLVVAHEHPAAEDVLDAARRAAAVDDPRLVRVLDVGHDDGVTYVVTEWLDGRDLATLVAGGAMAAEQARALVGEASLALEAARHRGLHHLRLRPSLVHLLEDGSVKVEGLVTEAALDRVEIEDGDEASRLDAHGLVALAYTALTGTWPGDGDDRVPPAPALRGAPAPPSELVSGVPADLDALCAQALAGQGGPATPGDLAGQIAPWGAQRRGGRAPGAFPHPLPPVRLAPGTPGSPGAPLRREGRTAQEPSRSRSRSRRDAEVSHGVAITAPTTAPTATTSGDAGAERAGGADGPDHADGAPTRAPVTAPTPVAAGPTDSTTEVTTAPAAERTRPTAAAREEPPAASPDQSATRSLPTLDQQATQVIATPARERHAAEHPTTEHPTTDHPTTDHPTTEHSTREHPTREHPTADHPAAQPGPQAAPAVRRPAPRQVAQPAPPPAPQPAPQPGRRRTLPADLLGIAQGDPQAVGATAVGRAPREHSRTAIALLIGFLVLVLLLAWRGLSGLGDPFAGSSPASSGGSRSTSSPTSSSPATAAASASSTPTGASTPVQVQQAAGFDPRGDGSENDQEAGRATDGDAGTSWTSETYRSADFGGLKPGVGLRLDLGGQHDVHRVQVEVGGSGSTVQLRRAHGDTLSSKVLDQRRNASGTVSLVPSTALRTDELVVWFTRAARSGGGYRVEVAEVTVS